MTSILCLAHYCDIHGPTPLMVTEGSPVACSTCYEDGLSYAANTGAERPWTSAPTPAVSGQNSIEVLRQPELNSSHRSMSVPAIDQDAQTHRAALLRAARTATIGLDTSALKTPPESPRMSQQRPTEETRTSAFKKTYDESVTKRAGPCDNCAMTLPPRLDDRQSHDPNAPLRPLRSRVVLERIYSPSLAATPRIPSAASSQAPSSEPSDDETHPERHHRRAATATSAHSQSSSGSSSRHNTHAHYVNYYSTHEPLSSKSFSTVRASCLRTLSFETLPRPPATGAINAMLPPMTSLNTPAFVTTQTTGSAASGGPIFFGDPIAGYTTAYIFRIPDVHARGHKRVYAFLALSTHRERLAMKAFGFIASVFHDLATWIQHLAEAEAERVAGSGNSTPPPNSPVFAGPGHSFMTAHPVNGASDARDLGGMSGSSFLSGGGLSRRMGAGFAGPSVNPKQRGLAEIVGMPNFFCELHSRFVMLMLEVGVLMNS